MPPLDAQPGVEGAPRQGLPRGDGDHRPQPAGVARPGRGGLQLLVDHAAGGGVDGRLPHRLVETGPGHPAHPLAAVNGDPRPGAALHPGADERPVGHVGIVAAVLAHRAGGPAFPGGVLQQLRLHPHPRRGVDVHGGQRRPLQQQGGGPGGGGGGAGAGGVAAAQPLPPHRDIELQFPHVCPPFDAKRPSSRLRRALIPGYTAPLHLRATQLPLCSGSPGLRFLLRRAFSAPLGQWLVHLRPRLQ